VDVYFVFGWREFSDEVIVINIEINRYEICLQDSLTLLRHVGHVHHRLHLGHVSHLHRHLLLFQGLALPHHGLSLPHHGLDDRVGKDAVGRAVDDWSGVMHDGVSCQAVVGNWVGNSMVGNRVCHCVVGNGVGNCMVGHCMMGNWMSHCMMGNRVGNSMVGNRVSNSM